jgi:hypothetical protein
VQATYNKQLGFRLFDPCIAWQLQQPPPMYMMGQILITVGTAPKVDMAAESEGTIVDVETPWTTHPGGVAAPLSRKSDPSAIVAVRMQIDPAHAGNQAVWMHEFGHAAGLAHDRLRTSIMWPRIQERAGTLSAKDVQTLRGQYGK